MNPSEYLEALRIILTSNRELVGNLEYTSGNYDGKGNLIPDQIPTITTDVCEIGIYDDTIYFTFIILASDFNKDLFNLLDRHKNMQIYPFKDFNNNLYPKSNFNYLEFEQQINNDQYLQISFNDNYKNHSTAEIMNKYLGYKNVFELAGVRPINQLEPGNIKL